MICSSAKMKRGAAFIVVNASNIEKRLELDFGSK
jgi:hypothetical protein